MEHISFSVLLFASIFIVSKPIFSVVFFLLAHHKSLPRTRQPMRALCSNRDLVSLHLFSFICVASSLSRSLLFSFGRLQSINRFKLPFKWMNFDVVCHSYPLRYLDLWTLNITNYIHVVSFYGLLNHFSENGANETRHLETEENRSGSWDCGRSEIYCRWKSFS